MIIRDILDMKGAKLHTISPAQALSEAVHQMMALDIGSLLVMEGDRLAGIITPHDVLRALDNCRCDLTTVPVREVMTQNLYIGSPDDTVDDVRGVMTENHISHLPVMENHKLVGLISFHDVAKAALKATAFENMLLKHYIKNWPEEEKT
jgi:CBS domain-containing protein